MIEVIVIDFLNKHGFKAYGEHPKEELTDFIIVEKTASKTVNQIKTATITIQSYSDTLFNTMKLNEEMKEKMGTLVYLDSVSRCKCITDYNFTDQTKKKYRYQAIFEIAYYQRGTN